MTVTVADCIGLVSNRELDAMPCACPLSQRPRCGRGWIRCRRKMSAWARACRARLRIVRRLGQR